MRPLEGITVLDFTQAYSGPYCAMNLADYGARVIKVERVDGGDQSRFWHPYAPNGNSGYFAIYNRNKEGIAVDLSAPEGKEVIKKLYSQVDVVLQSQVSVRRDHFVPIQLTTTLSSVCADLWK